MFRTLAALLLTLAAATGTAHADGSALKGTVVLKGKAPEAKEVNMKADPFCAKQPASKDEELTVGAGGGLKNVVVRIAKGLSGTFPTPAAEVVLDQNGCMYRPRVAVAQAGQVVTIKNSDQTLHNVHTYKGPSTLFNQAQVFGMPPIKKKAPSVGDVIKFKCDVHPWMTGYLVVTDNPFYAVTGADGSFSIPSVPPGTYTVEAWHEKLGTKTATITVTAGKPAELKLELAAK
jgi:plastocyanin